MALVIMKSYFYISFLQFFGCHNALWVLKWPNRIFPLWARKAFLFLKLILFVDWNFFYHWPSTFLIDILSKKTESISYFHKNVLHMFFYTCWLVFIIKHFFPNEYCTWTWMTSVENVTILTLLDLKKNINLNLQIFSYSLRCRMIRHLYQNIF